MAGVGRFPVWSSWCTAWWDPPMTAVPEIGLPAGESDGILLEPLRLSAAARSAVAAAVDASVADNTRTANTLDRARISGRCESAANARIGRQRQVRYAHGRCTE